MNLRFWKKPKTQNDSRPNPHVKLDPEINEIPELKHDIILGLLRDSNKMSDEPFLLQKYKLSSLLLKEYVEFMVREDLLQIFWRRNGGIERVVVTDKGHLFVRSSEPKSESQSPKQNTIQK